MLVLKQQSYNEIIVKWIVNFFDEESYQSFLLAI